MDMLACLQCLHPTITKTTLRQCRRIALAMVVMTGRVTMLGLSRWAGPGGSYRTVQRFFATVIPWATLFWVFFLFTPLQYVLIWLGNDKYSLYSIMIPVFAFLFIPARVALSGDYKRFLERVAKIQSGLLICVYCLSFAPALLYLPIPGEAERGNARLLFFFVTIALFAEAMQFIWSRLYGQHVIAPSINAARTWEGLIGGTVSAALAGIVLYWATPYQDVWQAALMSMIIAVMGFAGAMTMSAIKRDRGVRDYGTLVEGHGGVLDRIDAICFAAPVFYLLTRQILLGE